MCVCVWSDPWQELFLSDNQIGDVGVSALARAAEAGSLASLTKIYLMGGATASAETRDAMGAVMAKRGGLVVW